MDVVQPLVDQPPGGRHDGRVDGGQDGGVVSDRVLDQQHHPHGADPRVVVDVGHVLEVLDDGDQQGRVVLPQEDPVHPPPVGDILEQGQRGRVGDECRHGQVRPEAFGLAGEIEGQFRLFVHNGQDEVDLLRAEHLQGALDARHLTDAGDGRKAAVGILLPDPLLEGAVLLQDEGVVDAREQQDLADAVGHQGTKRVEAVLDRVDVQHAHHLRVSLPLFMPSLGMERKHPRPGPARLPSSAN